MEDGEQESQGRFAGNYDLSKEELAKLSKDEDFMKQFRETQEGMGQRNVVRHYITYGIRYHAKTPRN